MWEKSRRLDPTFATVHRNLALAYSRQQRDLPKAIASLEKAVECDANDPRFFLELDSLYEANNTDPARRLAMLESHHATVARSDVVLRREIAMLTFAGKYDRAIELLSNNHFRLWEGETGTHDLHMDAYLLRGRQHLAAKRFDAAAADFLAAMEYPDRYETARPTGNGGRLIQANYFLGLAYEGAGKSNEAQECFTKAAGAGFGGRGQRGDSDLIYYQAMALKKLGQTDRAAALFDSLIRDGNQRLKSAEGMDFFAKFGTRQSPMFQQASAHYLIGLGHLGRGDRAAAKAAFDSALKTSRAHLWANVMAGEVN
jgi:tetratricopeptide (TPR) repeat protein